MPLQLNSIHHIAIICSDYAVSKRFYTEVLGMEIVQETFREARQSYKLDLKVGDRYQVGYSLSSTRRRGPLTPKPAACATWRLK